jgi:sulfur carrier protein
MNIKLNGLLIETNATTLEELLYEQNIDINSIASAIDGQFIPRSKYNTQKIIENSKLEILSPMQGG